MSKKWLDNKTIVITGASSGIGKELTKLFIAKNNCHVIGIARSKDKMEKLIAELGEKAINFEYRLFDVSIEQNWIDFAENLNKPIDLLINNAGMLYKFDNFLNVPISIGKQIMDTNFYSVVYGCKHILPKINKRGGVVNICSSDALLSVAGTNYYAASKGAVKSFTQSLAGEFPNCYIGCVFPGFTDTDIFRDVQFNNKEMRLLKKFISPCNKISTKIYNAILKRKVYKVVGYDAKFFSFLAKSNPSSGAAFINKILEKSKLDVFSSVTNKNR